MKTECLYKGWQTSGSVKVVRMAFNLYCNDTPNVFDYKDMEEQIDEFRNYTVEEQTNVKGQTDGNEEVLQNICGSKKKQCSRKIA